MAYSLDDVGSVGAWTALDYDADDIALDEDNTACMTNTTLAEECDEWKEGVLNGRIEIKVPPAAIVGLKVRFYFTTMHTSGDNALLPYTDANSVSITNEVVKPYTITEQGDWVEHICDSAFIAELGDVGGSCFVRLASGEAGTSGTAKSKLGEVEVEVTWDTTEVAGFTYDNDGNVLVSQVVQAYKVISTGPLVLSGTPFDSDTSDAVTGAYSLDLYAADWVLISFDAGSPDKMDISERITVA